MTANNLLILLTLTASCQVILVHSNELEQSVTNKTDKAGRKYSFQQIIIVTMLSFGGINTSECPANAPSHITETQTSNVAMLIILSN
jgi:hypothetical protein